MTEQEKDDLVKLHFEINKVQANFFNVARYLQQADPKSLANTGYKTVEAGIMHALRTAQKAIKELEHQFFKKYPD